MSDSQAKFAKLREEMAAAAAAKTKTYTPTQSTGDNASFPFWSIPEGSTATVRFLPDGDDSNAFFWREREVIKLPFAGIVGGEFPTDRQVQVTVPCVAMYGEQCPIIAETKPWWKDDDKKELARLYYKKKSYIFQGFVVNSQLEEPTLPENPIRRFMINPSIFEIVQKALMDPDMADFPIDYVNGRDFRIAKTKKGEYANYTTSSYSIRTRALSESELIAIEQHGLFNLADFRGRKPDADEMAAIIAMFHDSLDGKPFDHASYGKWYRPYGVGGDDGGSYQQSTRSTAAAAPVSTTVTHTVTETSDASVAPKPSATDIMERIRNRTKAAG